MSRLRYTSIRTEAAAVTNNGFELRVEIPLPSRAAEFLIQVLREKTRIDKLFADDMRSYGQVSNQYASLTDDEVWMMNFYQTIGTFDISWTAQSDDPTTPANSP
jgi:hypothetical protein